MMIGVVVATYNGEKYIAEQLYSILNQTQKPSFIVISDGGSVDRTTDICEKILSKASSVDYVILTTDRRLGVSENFQKGLEHCDCDYTFLADQDDVWLPNKIERVVQAMISENASFAFTNAEIVNDSLEEMGISLWQSVGYFQTEKLRVIEPCQEAYIRELLRRNVVTGMSMCLRKDCTERVLPFDSNVLHDKWIAMYAALELKTVAINERFMLYRQHRGNVVGTKTNLKKMLKNSKTYYRNVWFSKAMLEKELSRTHVSNSKICNLLNERIAFYEARLAFMSKKLNFVWPFFHISEFKRMETDWASIIIKDYIVRFMRKMRMFTEGESYA